MRNNNMIHLKNQYYLQANHKSANAIFRENDNGTITVTALISACEFIDKTVGREVAAKIWMDLKVQGWYRVKKGRLTANQIKTGTR